MKSCLQLNESLDQQHEFHVIFDMNYGIWQF